MQKTFRAFAAATALGLSAGTAPLAAQPGTDFTLRVHPALTPPAPAPALRPDALSPYLAGDERWLPEIRQQEVTRPRWVFPVAGLVMGGAAGYWFGKVEEKRGDFLGAPVGLPVILGTLGAAGGGLTGWYVDAAQRQWIRTRPERDPQPAPSQ